MTTIEQRNKRAISLYRELARAEDSVRSVMERQLHKAGIGVAQFRILDLLLHAGPTPQVNLADV